MCPKKANATSARKKDYYTQLLEDFKILDFVKNFTKDFTFHDKKYFDETGNTFPFILGIRETGTNIEDLAQSQRILHEDHSKLSMIEDHFKYWIVNPNQRWFFGNNGEIREISREETEKIFRQYVDEAMAWKPITEPTKIWVTAKFNLGKAIETYLRDYIEELQMGSLRIEEKTENQLINLYLKEAYQRDLDSEFTPAEQKEMQKIFAYDPEFSKTMKKIFPSAKIKKEIVPMLKAPVEVGSDSEVWFVEKLNPSNISIRGEKMQYIIIHHPTSIHLQGVYPNGMLRMFDEPKKRKNQKFTHPIEFTPETLRQTLLAEGVPASFLWKEVLPLLTSDAMKKVFGDSFQYKVGDYVKYAGSEDSLLNGKGLVYNVANVAYGDTQRLEINFPHRIREGIGYDLRDCDLVYSDESALKLVIRPKDPHMAMDKWIELWKDGFSDEDFKTFEEFLTNLLGSTLSGKQMSSDSVIKRIKVNIADIPMVTETADGQPAVRAKDLAKFNRVMQGDMLRADKIAISQIELDQIKLVLLENGKDDLWETLSWILTDDKRLDLFDIHVRDSLVTLYQGLIYFLEKTYANFDEEFALVQDALKFLDLPLFESLQEVKDLYDHKISWKDFIDSKFGKIESQVKDNLKNIDLKKVLADAGINEIASQFEDIDVVIYRKGFGRSEPVTRKGFLNVPHFIQGTQTGCSETSIKMVMSFYGVNLTDSQVAELYALQGLENMESLANQFIPSKLTRGNSFQDIARQINAGNPVILRIIPEWQDARHSVVAVGMDDTYIYLNDPAFDTPIRVQLKRFKGWWFRTGNLMMSFAPLKSD